MFGFKRKKKDCRARNLPKKDIEQENVQQNNLKKGLSINRKENQDYRKMRRKYK